MLGNCGDRGRSSRFHPAGFSSRNRQACVRRPYCTGDASTTTFSYIKAYGMSSYKSDYPSVDFDPAYKAFFEQFYQISDTPDAHEIYAEQFSKSARLVMASRTVNGRAGTYVLRVSSCRVMLAHSCRQRTNIFPDRDSRPSKGYVGEGG